MSQNADASLPTQMVGPARDWLKTLGKYREPDVWRSSFEIAVTLCPFVVLWVCAWWALSVSWVLALFLAVINAAFLLRLFCIQHDCGHGAFFKNRAVSDWVGRGLGVLTLTPYDVWRRSHAIHHGAAGDLGRRGIGDVQTLTVEEYRALSWVGRLKYRTYRNPIVMFGLGPGYLFLLQNRLPLGLMSQARFWVSAMLTNVVILCALGAIVYFKGFQPILLIFMPTTLVAATIGVWLFYVQHQFENTYWEETSDWDLHDAAFHGSSHYVLPPVLQWLTANIGIHHIHHLYSRIPFYRLPQVLVECPALGNVNQLTIRESFAQARLHLWDEERKRLVPFSQIRNSATSALPS